MSPSLGSPPHGLHAPDDAHFEFLAALRVPPAHARASPATSTTISSNSESDSDDEGFEFLPELPRESDCENALAGASAPTEAETANAPNADAHFVLLTKPPPTIPSHEHWHAGGRGRGRGRGAQRNRHHEHAHGPRHAHAAGASCASVRTHAHAR